MAGARSMELLEALVDKSLGPDASPERRRDLLRYCARLVSTRMRVVGEQEQMPPNQQQQPAGALASELCRLVRRVGAVRGSAAARGKCDELLLLLLHKGNLARPAALVRLLCELGGSPGGDGRETIFALGDSVTRDPGRALEAIVGSTKPQGERFLDEVAVTPARDAPAALEALRRRAETEALLVRDVLYAFQGIDGHFVKFNPELDRFTVSPIKTIPSASRRLVLQLCEVGWLFKRVAAFVARTLNEESLGLVAQRLSSSLKSELTEFYRLIAVLESQLDAGAGDPSRGALPAAPAEGEGTGPALAAGGRPRQALTLRQLAVWSSEPRRRLQIMAEMADSVQGLIGGALASVLHVYSMHGDPFVSSFAEGILNKVSAPLFENIRLWVIHGELSDLCGEFFVSADLTVEDERLWFDKYKLQLSMVPGFIGKSLAKKILLVGKSINFMRRCCGQEAAGGLSGEDGEGHSAEADFSELQQHHAAGADAAGRGQRPAAAVAAAAAVSGSASSKTVQLLRAIDRAALHTNERLLRTLFEEFDLLRHCRALKQYLLLGQGDMIQYLMDLLSPQLALPAAQVYRHTLAGQLETAVRASNAQLEVDDVLERLDVRLLQASPGDSGWDVFVLDYHLSPPLNCVITADAMTRYYEIFTFLWRLKRVEHSLSSAWKQEMTTEHVVREMHAMRGTLHKFHVLRNEMIHFTSNLHSYIMFEVLETSWEKLVSDLHAATDLDQVVRAHERYLAQIMQKSLIGSAAQLESEMGVSPVAPPTSPGGFQDEAGTAPAGAAAAEPDATSLRMGMQALFDLILRFCSVQKRLYTSVLEQVHKLQRTRLQIMERTRGSRWGIDRDAGADSEDAYADPAELEEAQEALAREYDHQARAISNEYRAAFRAFLDSLRPTSSENLKFLRFRLDFNLYYGGGG